MSKREPLRFSICRRPVRERGESLIEALIALGMLAVLSVDLTRVQLSQRRLLQDLELHMRAAGLLEMLAETHRMEGVPTGGGADIATLAAGLLPDGRAAQLPLAGGLTRWTVSWQRPAQFSVFGRPGMPGGEPGRKRGAFAVSGCEEVTTDRRCLSLLLADGSAAVSQ